MSDSRNTETAAVFAFLAGAVFAAGVAMLLTPKTGREVREKLGDVTEDAVEKLKTCAREARFKVGSKARDDNYKYEGGGCWI